MANDNFALGIGVVAGLGYLFTRMKDDKEEFREEEWYPRFYRERMALKKTRKQTKDAEMVYRKYKGRKGPALSATSVKRGTRRRGNDGNMWEVRKSGKSQRWFKGAESFSADVDWEGKSYTGQINPDDLDLDPVKADRNKDGKLSSWERALGNQVAKGMREGGYSGESFEAHETVCLMCGDYKAPKQTYCCADCSRYSNERVNPLGGKRGGGFPRGDIAKAVLTLKEYGGEMSANQWKARIRDVRPTRKELNTNEIHKLVRYLNPAIYIRTEGEPLTYQITGGNCYDDWAMERYQAESFSAELKRDSCCCGATKSNPCACMIKGVMNCSAVEPKCPCYAAKDAESFEAEDCYICGKTDEELVLFGKKGFEQKICISCKEWHYPDGEYGVGVLGAESFGAEPEWEHICNCGKDAFLLTVCKLCNTPVCKDCHWQLSERCYDCWNAAFDAESYDAQESIYAGDDGDILEIKLVSPARGELIWTPEENEFCDFIISYEGRIRECLIASDGLHNPLVGKSLVCDRNNHTISGRTQGSGFPVTVTFGNIPTFNRICSMIEDKFNAESFEASERGNLYWCDDCGKYMGCESYGEWPSNMIITETEQELCGACYKKTQNAESSQQAADKYYKEVRETCHYCENRGHDSGGLCTECNKSWFGPHRKTILGKHDAESFDAEKIPMPKLVGWEESDELGGHYGAFGMPIITVQHTFIGPRGGKRIEEVTYEAISKRVKTVKNAESFEAEWDFGDDRKSLRKGDEHSDFNNAWRWIFKTQRREWPKWGQKFYDKYEWTLDDPHWNPQLDAESFEAPREMEEEDFTPMDITQCHVCARPYEYSRIARALVQHYLKESKDGTMGWKTKGNPDGARRTVRNIAGYQLYWHGLGAIDNYMGEGKISRMSPLIIELLRTAIVPNIIAGDVVQFIESMEIDDIEDTDPKFFTDFSDTWEAPNDRLKPERPSDDTGDSRKDRNKPKKPWRAETESSK